jgi:hypothetical protein
MAQAQGALPLIPFLILAAAAIVLGILYLFRRLTVQDMVEVAISVGTILITMVVILLLMSQLCLNIRPVEQFTDGSAVATLPDDFQSLLADITESESIICKLIAKADDMIKGTVPPLGSPDPEAVAAAQQKAREAVGAPLVACTDSPWESPTTETAALQQIDERLTRMEATVQQFTGPQINTAYTKLTTCEGFEDAATLTTQQQRLLNVRTAIQQQEEWLQKIQDKSDAMQRGEMSDCDRQKGAASATTQVPTGTSTT